MRKISILITSLFLTIIFAFSGCSCDNTMPLSFKDSFLGTNSSSFYKEVLRYKVTYKENYNDAIVKNDNFSDKYGLLMMKVNTWQL